MGPRAQQHQVVRGAATPQPEPTGRPQVSRVARSWTLDVGSNPTVQATIQRPAYPVRGTNASSGIGRTRHPGDGRPGAILKGPPSRFRAPTCRDRAPSSRTPLRAHGGKRSSSVDRPQAAAIDRPPRRVMGLKLLMRCQEFHFVRFVMGPLPVPFASTPTAWGRVHDLRAGAGDSHDARRCADRSSRSRNGTLPIPP